MLEEAMTTHTTKPKAQEVWSNLWARSLDRVLTEGQSIIAAALETTEKAARKDERAKLEAKIRHLERRLDLSAYYWRPR